MSSQFRYRMPWKIQKRSSEPDRWLDEMGFFRKHIARDASCLFRAVSENIYNTQRYFHKVRTNTINFMSSKRHLFEGSLICPFENYIKEMSNPTEWGGLIEITAMSHLYRRDFVIFEANKGSQTKMCNGYGEIIYLFYSPESKHFDAVYTKEYIDASSFCQSRSRLELRYGARYSDGTTLQVGVKCLCKLAPDQPVAYRCHIQEMRPDGGPCLVFIEELGEKKTVLFEQLEPLPVEEVKPWAPPYRYSQAKFLNQMLPQLGNIAKKQNTKVRKVKSEEQGKASTKLDWKEEKEELYPNTHYDLINFAPMPVEVKALPLMVDCRPAGAPPHDLAHPPNGTPQENHHNQPGASGDMGSHVAQNSGRASTPASSAALYSGGMSGCAYTCGKSVVWCAPPARPAPAPLAPLAPPPHVPPPPPPGVNAHAQRSLHPQGADLPINDLATLRYFYNVGVECVWAAYGPPPPAHYARDAHLAHEMQQMSLGAPEPHKHKDKPAPPKTAQRPLLGPRFKRNQDGNQNNNHNQNKGHNNNQNNKGLNNRYQTRAPEGRPYEEVVLEPPLISIPYIPYPPPVYPIPYYPIDADPAMMGMMGGMGYVGYDEGVEYAMPPLYPPPYAPPALPALHHAPPAHPHPHPHPAPQHPPAVHPNTQLPATQHPAAQHPAAQHPTAQHPAEHK